MPILTTLSEIWAAAGDAASASAAAQQVPCVESIMGSSLARRNRGASRLVRQWRHAALATDLTQNLKRCRAFCVWRVAKREKEMLMSKMSWLAGSAVLALAIATGPAFAQTSITRTEKLTDSHGT